MRWPASSLALILLILTPPAVALADDEGGKPAEGEVSKAEAESRVTTDLAERLDIDPEEIRIVKTEDRLWPDQSLGCFARRGMVEPDPVPIQGYRIELAVGEKRRVYHTDRQGRFVACAPRPRKPIDPIR